jgi:signal transduction histidine kinase
MSRLVDDLLDGSRAHVGVFRLECSSIDIADILCQAAQACRPAMETRAQHFPLRLPPEPLRVNGDSVRLTQVFSNLLDNASKYTGEVGAIALVVTKLDDSLAVAVSDNGIGITAGALPDIFDLFVQEKRALPLRNGGLGVGLAIVRDLVEAHGGTVVGRSAGRDCGSEFVVTLPLVVWNLGR